MSYTIESFTEKVIHNANEEIVVGVNNNQVITGKKTFADYSSANQSGIINIGTNSNNEGLFKLSAENEAGSEVGRLQSKDSIEFITGNVSDGQL